MKKSILEIICSGCTHENTFKKKSRNFPNIYATKKEPASLKISIFTYKDNWYEN